MDSWPWLWDDLRYFLHAHRLGSLTLAARELGVSQSSMSRRIAQLERHLGAPLFVRGREGLIATDLAQQLLPHAEVVEGQTHDIERLAQGQLQQLSGTVRLAIPEGTANSVVLPHLATLHKQHPGLELELLVGNQSVDLVRREADIALRLFRPSAGDLFAKKLAELRLDVFASPTLNKRLSTFPVNTRLEKAPWVLLSDDAGALLETQWHKKHGGRVVLKTSSYVTLVDAVARGVGVTVLSEYAGLNAGLQHVAHNAPDPGSRPLYLVTHRALRRVPRVAAVCAWLEQAVKEVASEAPG